MSIPNYRLIRSKRKTLALVIDKDGVLIARAPQRMSIKQIENFIILKRDWINETNKKISKRALPKPFDFHDGSVFLYLGKEIIIKQTTVTKISLYDNTLYVPLNNDTSNIFKWIEKQAREYFSKRIEELSKKLKLYPKKLRLSKAKTRWGSMSSTGTISLNITLIMCPTDVIDYVIVHELCHIQHPNHSHAFWALVEYNIPDYKIKRNWLKENSSIIEVLTN